jgi:hypothetical protein
MTIWLDYNENYAISDSGEVFSKRQNRMLKPWNYGKYKGVWLGAGNKKYIHRLVAELFCPRVIIEKAEVDHINRNCYDNRACNIRWVSRLQNARNTHWCKKPLV